MARAQHPAGAWQLLGLACLDHGKSSQEGDTPGCWQSQYPLALGTNLGLNVLFFLLWNDMELVPFTEPRYTHILFFQVYSSREKLDFVGEMGSYRSWSIFH